MQPSTELLQLSPEQLISSNDVRYGLKNSRIESLMASIVEQGGVMVPLEVEETSGGKYRINAGHYRHAAVAKLNEEQGAGLTLPCVVVSTESDTQRMKRQLAENKEREDMTPMDTAYAIKKLMDAGVSRQEIRAIFSCTGGRKGNKVQPASNSFINMMLSFLEFPKSIQNRIHEGLIGVAGAYQLSKVRPDRRQEVLDKLEADRLASIEQEEKDEEKYLEELKKAEEAKQREAALEKEVEALNAKALEVSGKVEDFAKRESELEEAAAAANAAAADEDKKKALQEKLKAAKTNTKTAIKAAEDAAKERDKAAAKLESLRVKAAERAEKLAKARKEAEKAAKKKKAASGDDVQKAAAAVGASTQYVPLKIGEIRNLVHELTLPGSFPKVREIGLALESCFNGVTTDKQLYVSLAKITGEKKARGGD